MKSDPAEWSDIISKVVEKVIQILFRTGRYGEERKGREKGREME